MSLEVRLWAIMSLDGGKVVTLEERLWALSPRTTMQWLRAGYCVLRTLGLGPWANWG